jgi:hypothetical protein
MRFPLRLTADLALGLAMRSLRREPHRPLISVLSPASNMIAPASPIVWIDGPEPLESPETPRAVNSLASTGRHVFLPTTGALLRRRIHEFQPSARLHLTIRFDGAETSHDDRAGRQGAYRDALESVRTAKLSGFLLCAQLILHSPSEAAELELLHHEFSKIKFDGFLISPARDAEEDLRSVAVLRRKLLSRRWALLSTLLDSVGALRTVAITDSLRPSSHPARGHAAKLPAHQREESVPAP